MGLWCFSFIVGTIVNYGFGHILDIGVLVPCSLSIVSTLKDEVDQAIGTMYRGLL